MIQFLSGVVPFAEMAGFTPFLLQLLALRPSTCLVSGHPPSLNQSSLSPLPLASSKSSSVVPAFSCFLNISIGFSLPKMIKCWRWQAPDPKKLFQVFENCCENKMQPSIYPNRAKGYKSMTMLVLRKLTNNKIER